jgi:hypothetical protein
VSGHGGRRPGAGRPKKQRLENQVRPDDLQERLQLQPDPTQDASRRLFGLPVFVTSQIAINETYGPNNDTS